MNSIILLLLVGISLLLFLLYQQKKKVYLLKEALQEKEEVTEILEIKANLKGRDQERNRIAKDWHDGIGNYLSTLRLLIDTIQPQNPENHQGFVTLLEETQIEFRQIIDNELVNDFSDRTAILAVLEKWKRQLQIGNISFEFKVYDFLGYNDSTNELKHHLYRIAQELMTNVLKHAKANLVQLTLEEIDNHLKLSVNDNGVGISSGRKEKILLKSVRDRVQILKGQIKIQATDNNKTNIEVIIPLMN